MGREEVWRRRDRENLEEGRNKEDKYGKESWKRKAREQDGTKKTGEKGGKGLRGYRVGLPWGHWKDNLTQGQGAEEVDTARGPQQAEEAGQV